MATIGQQTVSEYIFGTPNEQTALLLNDFKLFIHASCILNGVKCHSSTKFAKSWQRAMVNAKGSCKMNFKRLIKERVPASVAYRLLEYIISPPKGREKDEMAKIFKEYYEMSYIPEPLQAHIMYNLVFSEESLNKRITTWGSTNPQFVSGGASNFGDGSTTADLREQMLEIDLRQEKIEEKIDEWHAKSTATTNTDSDSFLDRKLNAGEYFGDLKFWEEHLTSNDVEVMDFIIDIRRSEAWDLANKLIRKPYLSAKQLAKGTEILEIPVLNPDFLTACSLTTIPSIVWKSASVPEVRQWCAAVEIANEVPDIRGNFPHGGYMKNITDFYRRPEEERTYKGYTVNMPAPGSSREVVSHSDQTRVIGCVIPTMSVIWQNFVGEPRDTIEWEEGDNPPSLIQIEGQMREDPGVYSDDSDGEPVYKARRMIDHHEHLEGVCGGKPDGLLKYKASKHHYIYTDKDLFKVRPCYSRVITPENPHSRWSGWQSMKRRIRAREQFDYVSDPHRSKSAKRNPPINKDLNRFQTTVIREPIIGDPAGCPSNPDDCRSCRTSKEDSCRNWANDRKYR